MSGNKETPRQKMIGMMYLVLTALLALNVQREILYAFVTLNTGIEQTNSNNYLRTDALYNEIKFANNIDSVKVGGYLESSNELKKETQKLVSWIDSLKVKCIPAFIPQRK